MDRFDPFKAQVPVCPGDAQLQRVLAFPSIVIINVIVAVACLSFALWTVIRYNAVIIASMRVRRPNISNTLWICYFIALVLRSLCIALRYSFVHVYNVNSLWDVVLVLLSLTTSGVSAFMLCLALNHQRRFRSSFELDAKDVPPKPGSSLNNTPTSYKARSPRPPPLRRSGNKIPGPPQGGPALSSDNLPLLINEEIQASKMSEMLKDVETPMIILLVIYLLAVYAEFTISGSPVEPVFWIILTVVWGIQRIPIIVLLIIIVIHHKETETPSVFSKFILIIGTLCYIANDIPTNVWADILNTPKCFPNLGFSSIDIIHACSGLAQILFFIFLRKEFFRNKEECIWKIVSERQSGFDFRDFNEREGGFDFRDFDTSVTSGNP